jgi:RNA polymerase sigma factor (sigma-70 family)
MIGPLKPSVALEHSLWTRLASVAEASVERYRKSLPFGMEMEDLKQDIICEIPKLLITRPPEMETQYYVYCRASYEARRRLHRHRINAAKFFGHAEPFEIPAKKDMRSERVECCEELTLAMSDFSPITQAMLLLIYDGCSYKQIARRLGWSRKSVEFVIERAINILDVPGPMQLMQQTTYEIKLKLIEGYDIETIVELLLLGCSKARVNRVKQWLKQIERKAA